jgi:surfactin synthase thioesterase subunit
VPEKWIVVPRPNRAPVVRLVCFPHAGGGLSTYRGWPERLPVAEVGIVQLPGRGSRLREPLLESVSEAANDVAETILRLPAYPTVFFGHDLGALMAFETARLLRVRAWPLLALFVSGRRAPALPDPLPPVADLPRDDLIAEIRRRYGAVPDAVFSEPELVPLLLAGLRADCVMQENYRYEPGPPLACPLMACGGASDAVATRADLEAWRNETCARFSLHTFRGGHLYLEEEREAVTAVVGNHLSVLVGAMTRGLGVR